MWRRVSTLARGITSALQEAWLAYRRHRGSLLGAALAFYTLLSIAPLLVVAVALAGLVFGEGAARAQALRAVDELAGDRAAGLVEDWVDAAHAASSEATIVGVLLFLYGASRVFVQLESALDAVWEAPVNEHEGLADALRTLAGQRLLSFLLMLGFGLVIAGSLVAQTLLDVAAHELLPEGRAARAALRGLQLALSVGVMSAGFAIAFRRAPHRHIALRETALGALVTALLFSLGNALLATYFSRVEVGAAYGAAGSVVAVLLWMVYSGQIVLYGAELTRVVALRGGRVRSGSAGAPPSLAQADEEQVAGPSPASPSPAAPIPG
jgi:membrane protein